MKNPAIAGIFELRRSFVLTPFSTDMAPDESADPQLSDAATSIKIDPIKIAPRLNCPAIAGKSQTSQGLKHIHTVHVP